MELSYIVFIWKFLVVCTWLTFDLFLRPRRIYRLGIHPYEFWHVSRNNISISRIMYSKMPTKRKISIFFGFGLPSIIRLYQMVKPEFLPPLLLNLNDFHIIIAGQSVILLFLVALFLAVVSAMLLYQNCLQT